MVRSTLRRYAAALLGFAALFTSFRMARLEGWDDAFYVAQLTSLAGDRDLLLQDDLLALWSPFPRRLRSITETTDEGLLHNTFSIGPAVAHSSYAWPVIAAAPPGIPRGLRSTLALGSMACLVLTVLAMRQVLVRLGYGDATASLAAGLAIVAGPLALYGTRTYLGSHLLAAFFISILLLAGLRWLDHARPRDALLLGVAGGLLVITRWQDLLLLVLLVPAVFVRLVAKDASAGRRRLGLGLAAIMFAVAVSSQLLAWHVQYGTWLTMPQGPGYMRWDQPQLVAFVASTYHGLVPWMPAYALALLAAPFARLSTPDARALRLGVAAAIGLAVYASAVAVDWYGGESYGPRRLSSLAPLAAIGFASLLDRLATWARVLATLVVVSWAAFTLTAFVSGHDDLSVVFGAEPSRWHPTDVASRGGHWIDRPGEWPRMLRPGFSFSDRPRARDRVIGLAATAVVFAAAWGAWRALARSARLQRATVAAACAWLAFGAAFLAWGVAPAGGANAAWRTAIADREVPPDAWKAPGLADAARVVAAAHAYQRGEEERARQLLDALDAPSAVHVDLRDLAGATADPGASADLRALREGRTLLEHRRP